MASGGGLQRDGKEGGTENELSYGTLRLTHSSNSTGVDEGVHREEDLHTLDMKGFLLLAP